MKKAFYLLILCALACACNGKKPSSNEQTKSLSTSKEVVVPASIFYNRDSLNTYAERAYKLDDPKGQFVVGAAYYLKREGKMPKEFYTVSRQEADDFLMLSAGQGYQPAKDLIRCLQENELWHH